MIGMRDGMAIHGNGLGRFERVSYYDVLYDRAMVAPVGLHKMIGWWRLLADWWNGPVSRPGNLEFHRIVDERVRERRARIEAAAFDRGFKDGEKEAFERGFYAGRDAVFDHLEKHLGAK